MNDSSAKRCGRHFSWLKWEKVVKICPKYLLISQKKAENAIKVGEN